MGSFNTTLLPSAVRTTTQTSPDIVSAGGGQDIVGIHVILDATVNAGSAGSITVTINGKDPASGKYYLLLSGAAVTTVTTNVYRIYPGMTASANATANDALPPIFQIVVTANNSNPVTYSVGYNLLFT